MKTFKQHLEEQYLNESLSKKVLHDLEKFADRLFSKLNIDIAFTKHFKDRINDERNEPEIKASEMVAFFKKAFKKHGKTIRDLGDKAQALLVDLQKELNIPFVLKWDKENNEFDLIAKTIMRKKDFHSPNKKLTF